jgi:hypothetical protein
VALFSGEIFEDMVASLIWPYTLPPDLSVEWDASLVHSVLQLGPMVHNGIEHGWFHLQPEVFPPNCRPHPSILAFNRAPNSANCCPPV